MATQPSSWTGEKPRKESGKAPGRGWPEKNGGRVFPKSPTGSAQDIHRAPPHSVEAEQGVLGSMLISPRETIAECVEKINEEYFFTSRPTKRSTRSLSIFGMPARPSI